MEILHTDDGRYGRFYVQEDGRDLAEMVYKWKGDHIVIEHTEVNEILKGQSVGAKMVSAAVHWAREQHIKIAATCPFAKAVLEKKEEYSDVYLKL